MSPVSLAAIELGSWTGETTVIADVFYRRYKDPLFRSRGAPDEWLLLFRQVVPLIAEDVLPRVVHANTFMETVHNRLARELGFARLAHRGDATSAALTFLVDEFVSDRDRSPDHYCKIRLSLIEILFRELESLLGSAEAPPQSAPLQPMFPVSSDRSAFIWGDDAPSVRAAIAELNDRMRSLGLGFHYHNGFIQKASADTTQRVVDEPFWALVSGPRWRNVDSDMKEAIDRRDQNKPDAPFYALKALESTLKIISDAKGLSSGKETGAAAFIDNLVGKSRGQMIEAWEADILKALFRHVRNPQGHGPGSQSPLVLSPSQTDAVIESAMVWVKSLARRAAL